MRTQTPQTRKASKIRTRKADRRKARRPKYSAPWRNGIDWAAAGRKAYETRMRNLAAAGGAAAAPKVERPIVKADADESAYVTRLLAAIARTTKAADVDRVAAVSGRDMGGGWRVIVTDGVRALTRKGEPGGENPMTLLKAEQLPHGFTLDAEIESALRGLQRAHKGKSVVTIRVDGRKRTATLSIAHSGLGIRTVKVSGDLKTATLAVDLRLLLDGFGRGGRLGYSMNRDRDPISIDTTDGLRYVLMPVHGAA